MHRPTSLLLFFLFSLGCTRSPEAEFAKYLQEGKQLQEKKDYQRAILQLGNASRFMPKDPEPYYRLGIIALAMGNGNAATESLKRAVTLDPKRLDAILALAELLVQSRHPSTVTEGRKLAERALALAPDNVKALNIIALADLRAGKEQDAVSRLQTVLQRTPNNVETSINLALIRMTQSDRKGAEDLLRGALAASPQNATALFALADFYSVTGDYPQAAAHYMRGLRIQADHPPALAALGSVYAKLGRDRDADALFAQLARNPDRRLRYSYARRLLETGRKDSAIAEFSRIFQEDPTDREARTHLINAYLDSNRTRDAEQLLNTAISRNLKDAEALVQRARIHLSRGEHRAAEIDLQIGLESLPESAEAHYLIAQVHGYQGRDRLQQGELAEAIRLDPGYTAARVALSTLLLRKDPKGALEAIDSAPEALRRRDSALRIQRIWPLLELNRIEEARQAIAELSGAGNPDVFLQEAVLHMRQGDFAAARTSAQKALAANPADARALELILRCSAREPQVGLDIVRRHASQHSTNAAVQMFLGRLEMQSGNRAQARAAFESARSASGGSPGADLALIDLDIAERKLDEARRRVSLLLAGPNAASATAKLGLIEQVAGNYRAAVEQYRKVLQTNPREVFVLNSLAYILAEFMENPAEALRYAQAAKELAPENAAVDDTLGWTYYKIGSYPKAVEHLELAVERGASARRQAHLAMAYARNGNRVRARQTLTTALKLDPTLPEASAAKKVVTEGVVQ